MIIALKPTPSSYFLVLRRLTRRLQSESEPEPLEHLILVSQALIDEVDDVEHGLDDELDGHLHVELEVEPHLQLDDEVDEHVHVELEVEPHLQLELEDVHELELELGVLDEQELGVLDDELVLLEHGVLLSLDGEVDELEHDEGVEPQKSVIFFSLKVFILRMQKVHTESIGEITSH